MHLRRPALVRRDLWGHRPESCSPGSHTAQPGLSGCPAIPAPRTSSRSKAALLGMNSVSRSGASFQGQHW